MHGTTASSGQNSSPEYSWRRQEKVGQNDWRNENKAERPLVKETVNSQESATQMMRCQDSPQPRGNTTKRGRDNKAKLWKNKKQVEQAETSAKFRRGGGYKRK